MTKKQIKTILDTDPLLQEIKNKNQKTVSTTYTGVLEDYATKLEERLMARNWTHVVVVIIISIVFLLALWLVTIKPVF